MGCFFLPVWMTCTWIAGYCVHSGRTSGNKMRNSIRGDYVISFLLTAHHSFRPLIPAAEHLPDEVALSHSDPLVSASAHGNVTPPLMFTLRFPPLEPCFEMCESSATAFGVLSLAKGWAGGIPQSQPFCAELSFFARSYSPEKQINLKPLEKTPHKVFLLFRCIF